MTDGAPSAHGASSVEGDENFVGGLTRAVRRGSAVIMNFFQLQAEADNTEGAAPVRPPRPEPAPPPVQEEPTEIVSTYVRKGSAAVIEIWQMLQGVHADAASAHATEASRDGSPHGAHASPEERALRHRYRQEAWRAAVAKCILLSDLNAAELDFVVQATRVVKTNDGEFVYEAGDAPEFFYLVHSGTYEAICTSVNGDEWRAREYGPLENFGACEMLTPQMVPRTHSMRVATGGVLWGIPRRVVEMKLRVVPPPMLHRTASLVDFCDKSVVLFDTVAKEVLLQLMRAAKLVELAPGETLCKQGEAAREVYLVRKGRVNATAPDGRIFVSYAPPDTFGESAFFADDSLRVRAVDIVAGDEGATVIEWKISALETLIGYDLHTQSERMFENKLMRAVKLGDYKLFARLSEYDDKAPGETTAIDQILDAASVVTFEPNEVVVPDGQLDDALYVIKMGQAIAQRTQAVRGEKSATVIASLERGDCFGEHCLLSLSSAHKQVKRRLCIVAHAESSLTVLRISKDALEKLNRPFQKWVEEVATEISKVTQLGGIDSSVAYKAAQKNMDLEKLLAVAKAKTGKRGGGEKESGRGWSKPRVKDVKL